MGTQENYVFSSEKIISKATEFILSGVKAHISLKNISILMVSLSSKRSKSVSSLI